jgi:hypothetical protein
MLRRLAHRPDVTLRLGLGAFALGSLLRLFVHPAGAFWGDAIDGAAGFGAGALIGAFLLSVVSRRSCPRT